MTTDHPGEGASDHQCRMAHVALRARSVSNGHAVHRLALSDSSHCPQRSSALPVYLTPALP